jgi:hypothetical protein
MGDAASASAVGAEATLSNPGGLPSAFREGQSTEVVAVHKEWIQDASLQFLSAAFSLGDGEACAVSASSSSSGEIDLRDRPGPPEGSFIARNASIGATYARPLSDVLSAGLTVKFLYEKILIDEAGGFGVDAGLRWAGPVEGLVIGAAILHLGGMQRLRSEATRLPTTVRAGAAWTGQFSGGSPFVTAALDVAHTVRERRTTLHAGADVRIFEVLSLRAGYQVGESTRGLSAGAGIRYGIAGLDYAYAPLSADLGSTHTIGVRLLF